MPVYSAPPRPARPGWVVPAVACCGGCGLIVVILVAFGIYGGMRAYRSIPAADRTARQFIQYVQSGQDAQAYAMASPAWKQSSSMADFKTFTDFWRKQQGKALSVNRVGEYWHTDVGGTQITLAYDVHGSAHNGRVTIILVPQGKGYAVQSANFTLTGGARPGSVPGSQSGTPPGTV